MTHYQLKVHKSYHRVGDVGNFRKQWGWEDDYERDENDENKTDLYGDCNILLISN